MDIQDLIQKIRHKQSEVTVSEARYSDAKDALVKFEASLFEKYGTSDLNVLQERLTGKQTQLESSLALATSQISEISE